MKRRALLDHLQEHGCVPVREGGSHSIWSIKTFNNHCQAELAIPRYGSGTSRSRQILRARKSFTSVWRGMEERRFLAGLIHHECLAPSRSS